MTFIQNTLDRRYPVARPTDFDAWKQAARAGDRVSQYRLGRSLLDAGIYSNLEEGRSWLWKSANQDFAPAKYWLGILAGQGSVPGAKPGAALLWALRAAASAFRGRGETTPPLNARLRPLAKANRRIDCGTRYKLQYTGWWNRPALCAVEIGHAADGRLAVLLQSLRINTGTSVTNMVESVALRVLIELILEGYDPYPTDIAWFELWPFDTSETRIHELTLQWNPLVESYSEPSWRSVNKRSIPFDVSHAVLEKDWV